MRGVPGDRRVPISSRNFPRLSRACWRPDRIDTWVQHGAITLTRGRGSLWLRWEETRDVRPSLRRDRRMIEESSANLGIWRDAGLASCVTPVAGFNQRQSQPIQPRAALWWVAPAAWPPSPASPEVPKCSRPHPRLMNKSSGCDQAAPSRCPQSFATRAKWTRRLQISVRIMIPPSFSFQRPLGNPGSGHLADPPPTPGPDPSIANSPSQRLFPEVVTTAARNFPATSDLGPPMIRFPPPSTMTRIREDRG